VKSKGKRQISKGKRAEDDFRFVQVNQEKLSADLLPFAF
jgi:hypothetical protein